MAKRVTFGRKASPAKRKKKEELFPFGLNVMSKTEKSAYRKRLKKAGHGGGS
jgi:hypothetical protein